MADVLFQAARDFVGSEESGELQKLVEPIKCLKAFKEESRRGWTAP